MGYDRRNMLLSAERKKLKLQLCQAVNSVPDLTLCDHSDFVCILSGLLLFLKSLSSSEALFGSLFLSSSQAFFQWVLWIDHCMHVISRFTSLTELKLWDPCTISTLLSGIAGNLRVANKAEKCREVAIPSFYRNILEFGIKWDNLLWKGLWSDTSFLPPSLPSPFLLPSFLLPSFLQEMTK